MSTDMFGNPAPSEEPIALYICTILFESDSAYRIRFGKYDRAFWVPKSQITIVDITQNKEDPIKSDMEFICPDWLAKREGFEDLAE